MPKTPVIKEQNENLEPIKKNVNLSKSTRFLSLSTYADEKQIKSILKKHSSSIRAWAYIHHDCDTATPHYHVILRTFCPWKAAQVNKWFDGCKDSDGKPVNTFCQPCSDMNAMCRYILHIDEVSKSKGKHIYPFSAIVDFGLFDIAPRTDGCDGSYDIVNDILCGVKVRDLVRRYGREYIYHCGQFHEVCQNIQVQEGYKFASETARKSAVQNLQMLADDCTVVDYNFPDELTEDDLEVLNKI